MSTRSHRHNGSQSSNDPTGNGPNSGAGIPPTVTSNTDPANDNGLDAMIPVQQHTDVTTVLTPLQHDERESEPSIHHD